MNEQAVAPTSNKTPRKAWAVLAAVYFVSFMAPMAQMKIPPLAAWIIPAYHMDGASFGSLMGIISIIGLLLAFPASFICRKWGLKTTTIVSVVCLAFGTLVGVLFPSLEALYIGRLFEGVGIGLIGISAPACVAIWFPENKRGLALGIWATWFPLGMALMFNTAPAVAGAWGYETVFWACLVLDLIALGVFIVVFRMPEGKTGDIGVEGKFRESFKYLKSSKIWILGVVFFVFNLVQLGCINSFYNIFLMEIGYSEIAASSLVSVITIVSLVLIPFLGAFFDKVRPNRKFILLIGVYALFIISLLFAWDTGEAQVTSMWIFIITMSIGCALGASSIRPLAPMLMPATAMGATMAMAVLQFCQNAGAAIGSPVFGWAQENFGWAMASNVILIPLCVIAIVFSFFLRTIKKNKREESETNKNENEN